jgi:hypothetical protein
MEMRNTALARTWKCAAWLALRSYVAEAELIIINPDRVVPQHI